LAYASLPLATAFAQEDMVIDASYRLTLRKKPVSGTLWLYYYGWGYLDREELGQLKNGSTRVRLSVETTRRILATPSTPEAFLVALYVDGVGWFRSQDFGNPEAGVAAAIASLGSQVTRGAVRILALTPPTRQTIQVRNTDGFPRAGLSLRLS